MKKILKSLAATAGLFLLLLLPSVSKAQTQQGPFTIINWTNCPVEVRWIVYCNAANCPANSVPQTSNGLVTVGPSGGTVIIPAAVQLLAGGGTFQLLTETEVYLITVDGQVLNFIGPTPLVNSSNPNYSTSPGVIPMGNPCPTVSMLWIPNAVVIL